MSVVKVRNLIIGKGRPKIIIPIIGRNRGEILAEAKNAISQPLDMVEWRVDWFKDALDSEKVISLLKELRQVLKEVPLLVTFRTAQEGGEKDINVSAYKAINLKIACSGLTDLIDVEIFSKEEVAQKIIEEAHKAGVKVIASNHDFKSTPPQSDLVYRLRKMQDMGADIAKIAVMPRDKNDLLTVLAATEEMASNYADIPILTIAMGRLGMLSRLAGEVFGSAMTFGSLGKASAPGQIDVQDLVHTLDNLHNILGD